MTAPVPAPAFSRAEASAIRRFARGRAGSDPMAAALAIHAASLPEVHGSSSSGAGGYGTVLMTGDAVCAFLGVERSWRDGPGVDAVNRFLGELGAVLASRAAGAVHAGLFMSVDCSLYKVSVGTAKALASAFATANPDLIAAARAQAVSLAAEPLPPPLPFVPSSDLVFSQARDPDAGPPTPPTMVVCPLLRAPPPIEGFSEALQPSISEWTSLREPLPLLGAFRPSPDGGHPGLDRLRRDVPWMSAVVDRVEERLWLLRSVGRDWASIPTILVHGPSGIGKSYFARRLAGALGLGFAETSLAGSTDNREMEGTARGWTNARPSWPACSIATLRTANPLLFVDEVDKVDSAHHGDPLRTMLTMLDRDTASRYPDKGLAAPCDLSRVSWLLAANEVQGLGVALRDRIEVVTVGAPAVEHLGGVVEGVIADLARSLEVGREALPSIGDLGMRRVEDVYAARRSLRGVAAHVQSEVSRMVRSSGRAVEAGDVARAVR